jgi:hypothetical protein
MRATLGVLPRGNSTAKRRRNCAPAMRSLCSPISSNRRAPSPRMTGTLETGYQTTFAEAAQAGEGDADAIPIGAQSDCILRSADDEQALGGLREWLAGVGGIELDASGRGRAAWGSVTAASWSWPV